MLDEKLAEKYYQERIEAESWHGPYTEEELNKQEKMGIHKTLGVNVFAPGVFSFPMRNSLKNKLL